MSVIISMPTYREQNKGLEPFKKECKRRNLDPSILSHLFTVLSLCVNDRRALADALSLLQRTQKGYACVHVCVYLLGTRHIQIHTGPHTWAE